MASFISASLLVPGSTPPATRSFAGPARASTCLRQALGLATGQSLALETARLGRTCRAQQTKRAQDICGGCGGCCAGCDLDRNLGFLIETPVHLRLGRLSFSGESFSVTIT